MFSLTHTKRVFTGLEIPSALETFSETTQILYAKLLEEHNILMLIFGASGHPEVLFCLYSFALYFVFLRLYAVAFGF
jgi:hypothetical protein